MSNDSPQPNEDAVQPSLNEAEITFDAVKRAIEDLGGFEPDDCQLLTKALTEPELESLGEVRARLIASGKSEDVVDRAVKAGSLAGVNAKWDAKMKRAMNLPDFHDRVRRFFSTPVKLKGCVKVGDGH